MIRNDLHGAGTNTNHYRLGFCLSLDDGTPVVSCRQKVLDGVWYTWAIPSGGAVIAAHTSEQEASDAAYAEFFRLRMTR